MSGHFNDLVFHLHNEVSAGVKKHEVISILEALAVTPLSMQAVYLQNISVMDDEIMEKVIEMLLRKVTIWAINLGESPGVSDACWERFTASLSNTSVSYLYVGGDDCDAEMRRRMKDVLNANRWKHMLHFQRSNTPIIKCVGSMWGSPAESQQRWLTRTERLLGKATKLGLDVQLCPWWQEKSPPLRRLAKEKGKTLMTLKKLRERVQDEEEWQDRRHDVATVLTGLRHEVRSRKKIKTTGTRMTEARMTEARSQNQSNEDGVSVLEDEALIARGVESSQVRSKPMGEVHLRSGKRSRLERGELKQRHAAQKAIGIGSPCTRRRDSEGKSGLFVNVYDKLYSVTVKVAGVVLQPSLKPSAK